MSEKIYNDWASENEWFLEDDLLRDEAISMDSELAYEGHPDGPKRWDSIGDALRQKHPARFEGYSKRKPRWSDIADGRERLEAKKAYAHFKEESQASGREFTAAEYLESYFGG